MPDYERFGLRRERDGLDSAHLFEWSYPVVATFRLHLALSTLEDANMTGNLDRGRAREKGLSLEGCDRIVQQSIDRVDGEVCITADDDQDASYLFLRDSEAIRAFSAQLGLELRRS